MRAARRDFGALLVSGERKGNIYGPVPKRGAAEFGQVLDTLGDGQEVIAAELTEFAGKSDPAVGQEYFRFAIAAGIEEELAGGWVASGVFEAETGGKVTHGDPAGFAAPAHVNEFLTQGQHLAEGGAGFWGEMVFQTGEKGVGSRDDMDVIHSELYLPSERAFEDITG